jgi:hypothetical protein
MRVRDGTAEVDNKKSGTRGVYDVSHFVVIF